MQVKYFHFSFFFALFLFIDFGMFTDIHSSNTVYIESNKEGNISSYKRQILLYMCQYLTCYLYSSYRTSMQMMRVKISQYKPSVWTFDRDVGIRKCIIFAGCYFFYINWKYHLICTNKVCVSFSFFWIIIDYRMWYSGGGVLYDISIDKVENS